MNIRVTVILALALIVLGIYLFVDAPAPFSETRLARKTISINDALRLLNAENKAARALYTREIVAKGKKSGLTFSEYWQENNLNAGPLPAQFLRATAVSLEKNPVPLGLYLGSDFPISSVNKFTGKQLTMFKQLKNTQQALFFYVPDIKRYTYMEADIAISKSCASCHNKHKQSPKNNWALNDVMGATTWTYPDKQVGIEKLFELRRALHAGIRKSYSEYVKHVSRFNNSPEIGKQWPVQGYYLPDVKTFMQEFINRTAIISLASIESLSIAKSKTGDLK